MFSEITNAYEARAPSALPSLASTRVADLDSMARACACVRVRRY